jgi:hypothetical protein
MWQEKGLVYVNVLSEYLVGYTEKTMQSSSYAALLPRMEVK